MIFFVVVLAIGGLSNLLYVPWAYWSIWFTIYIFLTVGSIFQVAAFNLPKKGKYFEFFFHRAIFVVMQLKNSSDLLY